MDDRFDLVIVGGGPAGYEGAFEAARLGLKTALVESRELGGTCLNRGCIPTKALLHSAELYTEVRRGELFGVSAAGVGFDMGRVQTRKNEVVSQLREGLETLVKKNRVTLVRGTARVTGEHTVLVDGGRELRGENILIAAGSVPSVPPIPGAELENVVTSDGLLELDKLWESAVIVGGGVIGMEFASVLCAFGARVTVLEFMDSILPNMDKELSRSLKMLMVKRGVAIHTGARLESIERDPSGGLLCRYTEKDTRCEVRAEGVLIATGRRPNTAGLISADLGVTTERGAVTLDENGRTSVPSIYAAGDVTGGTMLAHYASAQAVNAVRHMAGLPAERDMSAVPGCVYTDPEIASVGLTQDEAKRRGVEVTVKKYPMSANGRTVIAGTDRGIVKVVAEKSTGRILGAQLMCARATDMISQFTAAIVNGLTLEDLGRVIFPHPTFSEGIGEAVRV